MAPDAEGDLGRAFAIGRAEDATVGHDHGIAPITARLVEAGSHLFHGEQRSGDHASAGIGDEAVLRQHGADRQWAALFILAVAPGLGVAEVVDVTPTVGVGLVRPQ